MGDNPCWNDEHFIGIDCFDLHKGLRALFFFREEAVSGEEKRTPWGNSLREHVNNVFII